jgi:hypothetical protein
MTKLSKLTPRQFEAFRSTIKTAVTNGETARWVQDVMTARGLEFGERMVQRYMERVRDGKELKQPEAKPDIAGTCEFTGTGDESAEINYYEKRIVTLDDALAKANADTSKWEVDKWEVTSWEVGAKGPDGTVRVTPLWRVHVKLKSRKGWDVDEFRGLLREDLRALAPSYRKLEVTEPKEPILVELSIFDAHFGKLAWSPETGQDYDLRICKDRYMGAARDLLRRAFRENPERVVYVVGNDFFHVDHKEATTSGTPMDTDGRWQKAFRLGVECCITVAEEAAAHCPVDILVVPGNHDREKAFCLGEVLDARFHLNHQINVMNDPDLYSYYRWGKVLLGFVHGDNHTSDKKRHELPLQMATDRALDWSETVWREWHLGHFHSELEDVWKYRTVSHVRDLALRILPSLSSTDAWHRQTGYASVLAAECHLYHKDKGRAGYLVHQTEP